MKKLIYAVVASLCCTTAVAELVDIPHPILDSYPADVRAMLIGAVGRFELMALNSEAEALGVAYGRMAIHYFAHGVADAAAAAFQNAAELDPDNYRWQYYLAVLAADAGDDEQAVAHFEKALSLQPDNVPTQTRLGLALQKQGRDDDALRFLTQALSGDANNTVAMNALAAAAEKRNDWQTAIKWYQQALDIQPDAGALQYRLGQAYRRAGDNEKAAAYPDTPGEQDAMLDDPLMRFVYAHSKPAGYYVIVGDRLLAEGEGDRAWNVYDLAYAIDPSHARAVVGMARVAFLAGDATVARTLVDSALQLQPDLWNALQLKGIIEFQTGDVESAVRYYERSLQLHESAQTRVFLGNSLMLLGRYKDAAGQFDQVADSPAGNAEVDYRAAMAHIAAGDCSAAEPRLLSAHNRDASLAKVVQALARIYATCLPATETQRSAALQYARLLYDGQPGLETAETLAMTYAAEQQFDDAVDLQTQAIFEALKTGAMDEHPQLRANMALYQEQQPARLPWPAGHAVFSPATGNDEQ